MSGDKGEQGDREQHNLYICIYKNNDILLEIQFKY